MASQTTASNVKHSYSADTGKITVDWSRHGETPAMEKVDEESREIFQVSVDGVEFRTVSWQRATVVFLKINFAMSILAVPAAMAALGSVGGSLSMVGFTALNTCASKLSSEP